MQLKTLFLILLLIVSGCSIPRLGRVSLTEENDWFSSGGKSDNNYTQGLAIGLTRDNDYFKVGQQIWTPDNLKQKEIITTDTPYAGWLYSEYGKFTSKKPNEQITNSINLGVIGPWAFGEQTQKWFHRLCNCTIPQGWDNQLHNELGVVLAHRYRNLGDRFSFYGFEADTPEHLTLQLGNVHTDIEAGYSWRIGKHLPDFEHRPKYGYYTFGGLFSRAIGRNIFYDGNTFRDSNRVDKIPLVAGTNAGVAFIVKGVEISFRWVAVSKEFQEQSAFLHTYGMIGLGVDW